LRTALSRFWDYVPGRLAMDECWIWTGTKNRKGYGQSRFKGATISAHRLMYILVNGSIRKDLQVDHLCRNHSCVNPAHLEAVTQRVNTLRGIGHTAVNARKKVCLNGHRLSGDNVYLYKGHRECKSCRAMRLRKYRKEGMWSLRPRTHAKHAKAIAAIEEGK
jgi:HNH endonuclease